MSELKVIRKRFIAGAVCPSCDAVDRIVVEVAVQDDGQQTVDQQHAENELSRRRCVACGFCDEYTAGSSAGFSSIPKGRPERPQSAAVNPVKVRILDPKEPGL